MKRKLLAVLLAGAMVLSMTACGAGKGDADSAVAENGTSEESDGDTGKVKLVVPKVGYSDDQIKAAQEVEKEKGKMSIEARASIKLMESVKETYPEYDVSWEDWGWAEALDQKQRSNLTAGTQVDILVGETFMPTYANEGVLEPLPQDIIDMVNPSFLLRGIDGKAYGVIDKTSVFMLFYNKDLMEKAGLDPEKPPKTWEEFQSMSEQITKAGNGEFWGGGIPTFPHAGGALRATPFFRQNGTDFSVDGKSNLSDAALQETLEFIRTMNKNFPEGLGNNVSEDPLWSAFQQDQTIAFAINGGWQAVPCIDNNMNWGVAPLPTKDGTEGNCLVGSVIMGVSSKSKHKEEAFNIIRLALQEDRMKIWLEDSQVVPLNSIIDDEANYADNEVLMTSMDAVKNATFSGLSTFIKNDSQVWEIVDQKVLARTTMTEDAIATICSDANSEIEPLLK